MIIAEKRDFSPVRPWQSWLLKFRTFCRLDIPQSIYIYIYNVALYDLSIWKRLYLWMYIEMNRFRRSIICNLYICHIKIMSLPPFCHAALWRRQAHGDFNEIWPPPGRCSSAKNGEVCKGAFIQSHQQCCIQSWQNWIYKREDTGGWGINPRWTHCMSSAGGKSPSP